MLANSTRKAEYPTTSDQVAIKTAMAACGGLVSTPGQSFRDHHNLVAHIGEVAERANAIADRLCGVTPEQKEAPTQSLSGGAISRMDQLNAQGFDNLEKIQTALARIHNVIPE